MSLDHRPPPEGSMRKAVTMLVMGGYTGSVITEGGLGGGGRKSKSSVSTQQLMRLEAEAQRSF